MNIEQVAHLYKITHLPTGLEYFGSTWGRGKTYLDRFEEHMQGRHSGKYILQLLNEGSTPADFSTELLLIGTPEYTCDIEHKLAKNTLWPKGLNGNAGKNIIRTPEGQAKVSAAVSKAKTGKTKENSEGVAQQAKSVREQRGDNRTEKQKEWDKQKSAVSKANGNKPPKLERGSRRMNNGTDNKWVKVIDIDTYLKLGWQFGEIGIDRTLSEDTKSKLRKPKSKVSCLNCREEFGTNGFKRWNHYERCVN